MILTRKKDPALNIGLGLLRYVVTTAVALRLLAVVLKAGDDFAAWLAREAVGHFAERMKGLLTSQLLAANPFLQIVLAGWALLLGAVQWALGLLREGGILVFAAVLPLAAAGGMNEATKPMLPRIISPARGAGVLQADRRDHLHHRVRTDRHRARPQHDFHRAAWSWCWPVSRCRR